ncbi:hypothetical protein [Desulfurivibrio sp. C05AmB]|uniref:hypothetical protein n=1 Tax=Desulfurivibrio sp. C05AmB TaxID=3374371 RepID=UPI00376EDCFD
MNKNLVQPVAPFPKKFGNDHGAAGHQGGGKDQDRQPVPATTDRRQLGQITLAATADQGLTLDLFPAIWTYSRGHAANLNRRLRLVKPEYGIKLPPPSFPLSLSRSVVTIPLKSAGLVTKKKGSNKSYKNSICCGATRRIVSARTGQGWFLQIRLAGQPPSVLKSTSFYNISRRIITAKNRKGE